MAFPTVVNTATSGATSTNFSPTMPASIIAGRLLVVIASVDNANLSNPTASGWTRIGHATRTTGNGTIAVYAKVAAGSDTCTISGFGTPVWTGHAYQIDNWSGVLSEVKTATLAAGGTVLDPPNLTMPAAGDYLWIAACGNSLDITTAPTNYTNYLEVSQASTAWLGSARRILNATSENPGAFGGTQSSPVLVTIGVPPSAPVSIETLTDNFDDNSRDTTKWPSVSGTTAEQNQRFEFSTNNATLNSASIYGVAGHEAFCQVSPPSGGSVTTAAILWDFNLSTTDTIQVVVNRSGNNLQWKYIQNIFTTVWTDSVGSYDATNHAWLRLRESAGTMYFEASPTGAAGSWTTLFSRTTPTNLVSAGSVGVVFTNNVAGTPATPGWIDNFNIEPAAVDTGSGFMAFFAA